MRKATGRRGAVAVTLTLVLLAAVALGACGSDSSDGGASKDGNATVTPTNGETIDVTANQPFTIKLESNPTTGYEWAVEKIDGTVKFVESKYVAPKGDQAGAPGEQVLTFDAGPAGTSTVRLAYERPFAPTDPGKTLEFEVDAQKG
jgi:inhibitor of cysteine peptidase